MSKRPSLFSIPQPVRNDDEKLDVSKSLDDYTALDEIPPKRPPSRIGKRVLSVYLDPLAWKQLRQLALDDNTTTQALGEEAINLLFMKHGLNRSA